MTALVVASWNLQGRDPARLGLPRALRDWNADVVLLQEADAASVDAALPPTFEARRSWPDAGTRPGIMIAARLPFEESGALDPVDPPWDRPRACWARLATPAGPLTAVSVHLLAPLAPGARRRRDAQRAALARWSDAQAAGGARLVVGGDFNTRNPRLAGMQDAVAGQPAATWRPLAVTWLAPMLRIDAIFVSPSIRPAAARVDVDHRGSDHLPVVARMEL